jgi:phosphatidylglycerol:prolipoprotein diacylglycerol transferase
MADGAVYYSLFNTLAYLAAGVIYYFESRRKKYPTDTLAFIALGALTGALIGSKLGSALFVYREFFRQHPSYFLMPQVGGKTIVGGLIGGYIGVVLTKRIFKFTRSTGDLFAPGLALGIGIGRLGCFLNGCCYGTPSALPWAVTFKDVPRHPTQIYESIFGFALFAVLWRLRRHLTREGDLFRIFLLAYTFFRFWIEFIRGDAVDTSSGLSLAQWICLAAFVLVAVKVFKGRSVKEAANA